MEQYSPEIIAILAVGVAIAGLILQQGRRLDSRIDALTVRTDDRFRRMAEQMTEQHRQLTEQMNERFREMNERFREMNDRFQNLSDRFQDLSDRVARIEGKLDLLETFVTHRNESPAEAAE